LAGIIYNSKQLLDFMINVNRKYLTQLEFNFLYKSEHSRLTKHMKKRLILSWTIYILLAVTFFLIFYHFYNHKSTIYCDPVRIDSIRRDSCYRDSIFNVARAAAAAEYARLKADSLSKQTKIDPSGAIKN